jgi:uncharacterized radical SAM superfamily protein
MVDVSKPGSLYNFGIDLWNRKGKGILISGGCDPYGAVDYPDHTFPEIKKLKKNTGLLINLHCGLVDDETAIKISESGVDKVSFDLVYDDETINEVLGLKKTKQDYLETISRLRSNGVTVVPHILTGLNKGRISWEFEAVKILSSMDVDEVVMIILIPTKETKFENIQGPDLEDIMELAVNMRSLLGCRIILGCMRPKGMTELERKVLEIGFDGIVIPGRSTVKWIMEQGWEIKSNDLCCCM